MSESVEKVYQCEVPVGPKEARQQLSRVAEDWGGSFQEDMSVGGGHLVIPVLAGLRHGHVGGPVQIEKNDHTTRLSFRIDESAYKVHMASAVTLLLGAFGALVTLVAPLVPALWALVPVGMMLSFGSWLFIVAKLRNSGPEEFFESLAGEAEPKNV